MKFRTSEEELFHESRERQGEPPPSVDSAEVDVEFNTPQLTEAQSPTEQRRQ